MIDFTILCGCGIALLICSRLMLDAKKYVPPVVKQLPVRRIIPNINAAYGSTTKLTMKMQNGSEVTVNAVCTNVEIQRRDDVCWGRHPFDLGRIETTLKFEAVPAIHSKLSEMFND